MQSQPWRSQRVAQGEQELSNGSPPPREGSSASIYATPSKPAKIHSTLKLLSSELPIELLSSPSRGLDQSDTSRDITNIETQAKYRLHISERIRKHCEKHGSLNKGKHRNLFPFTLPDISGQSNQRAEGVEGVTLESLQDILLLVRRLREGCVAAARRDAFAIDVYALSTFISILIAEDIQLSSSLPRLFDLLTSQPGEEDQQYAVQQDLDLLLGRTACSLKLDMSKGSIAALYLLWLSVTGGQMARVGGIRTYHSMTSGQWLQQRANVMVALSDEEQNSPLLKVAEAVQNAVSRCDVISFRTIVLDSRMTIWQQAIIRRSIDRLRDDTWNTLTKSYMNVPIDGSLMNAEKTGNDWLERMLLIDVELLPIETSTSRPKVHQPISTTIPDAWDDSIDHLADVLKSTSLDESEVFGIRARRLAAMLERYKLPQDAASTAANDNPLNRWKSRKIVQGGIPHLRLR